MAVHFVNCKGQSAYHIIRISCYSRKLAANFGVIMKFLIDPTHACSNKELWNVLRIIWSCHIERGIRHGKQRRTRSASFTAMY